MAPALAHGPFLGPFDWVSRFGLSADPSVVVHNRQTFDQISEFIPWTNLAWTQVHHGQLPLWNPYSLLGTPLAFNWQAGTFGVPALLGYLFPVSLAFTVQVMATLFIAGTGAYVLGRVVGLGTIGAAMAGVAFDLSGPFFGWLGWPISSVMAWAGWLFAATLLVVRPARRRAGAVALLAVVMASAVYAGQPDMLVLLGVSFVVFVVVLLAMRTTRFGHPGPIRRPVTDLVLGTIAGGTLGAPLVLPGIQLILGSVRTGKRLSPALPLQDVSRLVLQGFDGLPVAGSRWFGDSYYTKTVAYIGVIAVVLAIVALVAALRLRWRRPEVVALSAVALVSAAIVYIPVVESGLDGLPFFGVVLWRRATIPMAFALAMLAGIGADALARSARQRQVRSSLAAGFGVAAVALGALWLFGRGHLPKVEATLRDRSFIWPAACGAVGLLVAGVLMARARGGAAWADADAADADAPDDRSANTRVAGDRAWTAVGRGAALTLLAAETAFLVAAGAPLWSSSPTYLPVTAPERQLAKTVGSQTVGLGENGCFGRQLGIVPDLNVALGVRELADYEPLVPKTFAQSWRDATGEDTSPAVFAGVPFSVLCPAVTTVAAARQFGVGFVLEPAGASGPRGAVYVRRIGVEDLYRIPGSGPATLVVLGAGGSSPPDDAPGAVVPVSRPDPASWRIVTDAPASRLLRIRLTAVPGWHATVDGRPVALEHWAKVMFQLRVPAGRHVVELHYWPGTFSAGLGVAAAAVVGLCGVPAVAAYRRRGARCPRHSPPGSRPGPAPEAVS